MFLKNSKIEKIIKIGLELKKSDKNIDQSDRKVSKYVKPFPKNFQKWSKTPQKGQKRRWFWKITLLIKD